jgi:origin recognition complex subunit 3
MLPYDLNILHECVTNHEIKTLVLAFRNSEAFDQGVLNDLLSLIRFANPSLRSIDN